MESETDQLTLNPLPLDRDEEEVVFDQRDDILHVYDTHGFRSTRPCWRRHKVWIWLIGLSTVLLTAATVYLLYNEFHQVSTMEVFEGKQKQLYDLISEMSANLTDIKTEETTNKIESLKLLMLGLIQKENNSLINLSKIVLNAQDTSIKVRLVDSGSRSWPGLTSGRVEVYYNSQWGTVCNENFDSNVAKVFCRMLGISTDLEHARQEGSLFRGPPEGPATGPIWLSNLSCDGTESHIDQCDHNGWGIHSCTHQKDVSITCVSPN